MKKVFIVLVVLILLFATGYTNAPDYEEDIDYMLEMIEAAVRGDIEAGTEAAEKRNAKILALGLESYEIFSFDDFYLVSKVITFEYGSSWLPFEDKVAVGEVLFNRVNSPEFPDTFYDCVYQSGQYSCAAVCAQKSSRPFRDCAVAAAFLFNGNRILDEPLAVYQSGLPQGSEVFVTLIDPEGIYCATKIGLSTNRELYS